jgi:DNA-binding PadR family transcriptional regulator
MNLTRLVVLGLLSEHGPRHGHQLRRDVEIRHADEWAGVGVGSLHRELRVMSEAGLIEALRTERIANRPERTIYQISADGLRELETLRAQAIAEIQPVPDAMSVGLIFTGAQDPALLAPLVSRHREAVLDELKRLAAEREVGLEKGYLQPSVSPTQAASFRRAELHMRAELAWHDECDAMLTPVPAAGRSPGPQATPRG